MQNKKYYHYVTVPVLTYETYSFEMNNAKPLGISTKNPFGHEIPTELLEDLILRNIDYKTDIRHRDRFMDDTRSVSAYIVENERGEECSGNNALH